MKSYKIKRLKLYNFNLDDNVKIIDGLWKDYFGKIVGMFCFGSCISGNFPEDIVDRYLKSDLNFKNEIYYNVILENNIPSFSIIVTKNHLKKFKINI